MSGNNVCVDTNVLLYFLRGDKEVVEMLAYRQLTISFVTELELLAFPDLTQSEEIAIKGLISNCQLIGVNDEIKRLTIELRKNCKLKLPDSIVAATAMYAELPLITADKQFCKVQGLTVILYES